MKKTTRTTLSTLFIAFLFTVILPNTAVASSNQAQGKGIAKGFCEVLIRVAFDAGGLAACAAATTAACGGAATATVAAGGGPEDPVGDAAGVTAGLTCSGATTYVCGFVYASATESSQDDVITACTHKYKKKFCNVVKDIETSANGDCNY